MYGLGVNKLGATRSLLGDAIANLFSNGEQGVWYDPSDISTMFQESSLETPAVIGQPVGAIFDKSQGLKRGSELVTNGDFSTDTDWNKGSPGWSIANGSAIGTNVIGKNLSQTSISFTENAIYNLQFTVTRTAGNLIPRLGGTTSVNGATIFNSGTYNIFLKANSSSDAVVFRGNAGFTGTIDNVSVKRVLGNHAYQDTSDKRPVLARHPEGGIRNLLSYTQEFDNSYWAKGANTTVTANFGTAPDGTQTAARAVMPNSDGTFVTKEAMPVTAGVTYVFSVYARARTGTDNITLSSPQVATDFSLDTNWTRVSVTWTAPVTTNISLSFDNSSSAMDALIWGAQLEVGSTATQYQHVTDDLRYDITEPFGANSLNYLKFDGVSDGMSLTGLTSTSTPITAWFGYSATNAEVGGFKYLLDIETGRVVLAAQTDLEGQIGYYDGAWSSFNADANAIKVLTYDLVEDNAKIRVDGTQEYSDATYDQQAIGGDIGLFASYPLTGRFLAGNLYSCILRAAESTDKEIASTESYVAKKTGLLAQVDGLATLSLDFGGNTYTARNSNGGIL